MRHRFAIPLVAVLTASTMTSAMAQDESGPSLMEQGLELFFEGLRDEMGPTLESFEDWAEQFGPSMQGFMSEMGPALSELMEQVQDWSRYEMPEVLPNGDILIRRKPDEAGEDVQKPGEIEL